jgi:hypothetical protein
MKQDTICICSGACKKPRIWNKRLLENSITFYAARTIKNISTFVMPVI